MSDDGVADALGQVDVVAQVTVPELLDRIARARDWAQGEADSHYALVEAHLSDHETTQALAQQARAAAFEAVRVVLEEILQPGSHSAPRGE